MQQGRRTRHRRPLPEWLIGLVIAVLVVAIGILVVTALGAGDDPTFEGTTIEQEA